MVNKLLFLSALFLGAASPTVSAQRQISSFEEHKKAYGETLTIGGNSYSKPDIYYIDNGDVTYKAVRLTVTPPSKGADITVPYLNMATANSICVNWKTSTAAPGSVVKYGLSPEQLTNTCDATARAITTSYHWNTAQLTGLTPDTPYYYQVISNGNESEIYRFRTPAAPGANKKVRVLLIGDHQRNEHSDYEWLLSAASRTVREKYGEGPMEDYISFLLNDGDQVDGGYIDLYEKVHLFKSRYVSTSLPNMTVVGNHEYKNDPNLALYDGHYHEYASLPYRGITSGDAGYYAYQNGPVLIIALNSDSTTPEQKLWVRKVVAAADADETVKFIVSVQHRPLYAEQYTYDVSPWMLNEIMPILSSSPKHVLNVAGHHHLYARGQMTDTPVYHIITGGGVGTSAEGYEQLWGKTPDNRNHSEVQKTIDHWTYQILEFDPATSTMTAECYSIGNSRLALDNELVDTFSRKVDAGARPGTPTVNRVDAPVSLPATFTQATAADPIYTVQYQVAADEDFTEILLDNVTNAEDFYGATSDYRPLDINKDLDLHELIVKEGSLANGAYYLRARNRNSNLDWSDFSAPVPFTVTGASAPATIAIDSRFYRTGATIRIDYTGAPVNNNAWIGIYKENFRPGTSDLSTTYAYTTSDAGSCDITLNKPGAYFAVLFKDGGYTEITPRIYFTVSDNCDAQTLPSLSTDKRVYRQGDPVKVRLKNAPCIQNDWIGLYDSTVAVVKDGKSHSYAYVGTDPQGEVSLNVKGNYNYTEPVGDGLYYVTYCIDNEYFEPMERSMLVVGKPVMLEAAKAAYTTEEEVMVTYEGAPALDGDKVVLVADGSGKGEFPISSTGGTVSLGYLTAGDYEVYVATEGDNEISPRAKFTVTSTATPSDSWMSDLSDAAYLDQISIPGTHDAATGNGTSSDALARTQQLSLSEQFEAGVRAFDLRPSVDNGQLKIYHGIVATKLTFEAALDELCKCLDANPSETAIVVMRHEDDHESAADKALWNDMADRLLRSDKYTGRTIDFRSDLTVGDVRGKLLVLSRDKYASTPVGGFITGWTHSSDFAEQGKGSVKGASRGSSHLYVQDFYEVNDKDTKFNAISRLLDYSATLHRVSGHTWVINHTSGYVKSGLFATADKYRENAANTNTFASEYITSASQAGPTGIIMMDFAGVDKSDSYDVNGLRLVNAVIDNNSRYTPRGKQSGIDEIDGPDADNAVSVVGNGDIRAQGDIEVYTVSGKLYAAGTGRVVVTTPGIYVVRAGATALKLVVK